MCCDTKSKNTKSGKFSEKNVRTETIKTENPETENPETENSLHDDCTDDGFPDDDMDGEHMIQKNLMRIVHNYTAVLFAQLSNVGIYPGQVPVIMIVENNDGLKQSEICKKMHTKPSTVAVSMKRMEKKGLITRKPDAKDQRVTRIYATEELHEVYRKIKDLVAEDDFAMLQGFSREEITQFENYLARLRLNLKNMRENKGECSEG